jgi:hypothetical protein
VLIAFRNCASTVGLILYKTNQLCKEGFWRNAVFQKIYKTYLEISILLILRFFTSVAVKIATFCGMTLCILIHV